MRPIHLLVLLTFVLIATGAASASGPATSSDNSVSLLSWPNSDGSGLNMRLDLYRSQPRSPVFRFEAPMRGTPAAGRAEKVARESDTTCFAMRTYRMERDEQESDATHLAGYTTCLPGAQVNFKTADSR